MMKKIGVGFVGAGWMGSAQLQRLTQRDDVEVLALLEPNAERGREVLTKLGLSPQLLVSDYNLILSNKAIDAVWLVSPNSFHGWQSIGALEAGKHVFCEKPCSTTFADYCRQIELENANPNLKTYVDYILYFDTFEQRLRQMVADGTLGTIMQIQVNYRHPVNIAGDKAWKLRKDIMGDAIGMGINHALSVMIFAMQSQARPVSVFATNTDATTRGFEVPPIWNIQIRFDNGATGFCFGNIDNGKGYDAYHNLFGTEGALVFDSLLDRPQKVRYWSQRQTAGNWVYPLDPARCTAEGQFNLAWPADTTTPDSGNVVEHQTGLCVAHFLDCIHNGKSSSLSFANSATIAEIGWAAQMSAALNKPMTLPLDQSAAHEFFSVSK